MQLLSSKSIFPQGISIVRIITGIFLVYHGTQMFRPDEMIGYGQWLSDLKIPFPLAISYFGKVVEVVGGICLVFGIFTRIASMFLFFSFLFIALVMGEGKIFTDSQHPFLFALLAAVFFFNGPGPWSLDYSFFKR